MYCETAEKLHRIELPHSADLISTLVCHAHMIFDNTREESNYVSIDRQILLDLA